MSEEYVLISETLNKFLPCFNKNSFTLKKKYTVVEATEYVEATNKLIELINQRTKYFNIDEFAI